MKCRTKVLLKKYRIYNPLTRYFYSIYLKRKGKKLSKLELEEQIKFIGKSGKCNVGNYELILDLSELNDFQMYRLMSSGEVYEPHITQFLIQELREGDTFLDIGANIGYYSILASQLVGSSGRVFSFEPNKEVFERLKNNIQINRIENVVLFNFALSDFTGTSYLYLGEGDWDGRGSLYDNGDKVAQSKVTVKRFDDVFKDEIIDMVKMDVEGSEIRILKTMESYLSGHKQIKIVMEWNNKYRNIDDFRFLRERFHIFLLLWESDRLNKIPIKSYIDLPGFGDLLLLPK